jgi:IMP dehydrogenase/GMP reductase
MLPDVVEMALTFDDLLLVPAASRVNLIDQAWLRVVRIYCD